MIGRMPDGLRSSAARRAKPAGIDWKRVADELDRWGFARIPRVLGARECAQLAAV